MTQTKLDQQGLPEGYQLNEAWEVTPRQVKQMRDSGEDFLLVDCRTQPEYELCRIEGAQHLPLQQAVQHAEDLLDDEVDKKIVILCHHGMRSLQMAAILREMGLPNTWSMAGGIDLWSMDVDPTVLRY